MGFYRGPKVITDGLILYLDAANPKSYSGTGSNIVNLVDGVSHSLNGTYSLISTNGITGIRLNNPTTTSSAYIQLNTLTNITTVSLWYYVHSNTLSRYLLDMRTGGTGGYIYSGGPGSNWNTGLTYLNGVSQGTTTWAKIEPSTEVWRNIVVTANTPATDDMNLFSRYSDTEGYNVTFGAVQVYNRVLSAQEIQQNYNATKSRFGL